MTRKRLLNVLLPSLLIMSGMVWKGVPLQDAEAQDLPPGEGSLVVDASPVLEPPLAGHAIEYRQLSQDFLTGFEQADGERIIPADENPFNLSMQCIPWGSAEQANADSPVGQVSLDDRSIDMTVANECLLYFGQEAASDLPSDLSSLPFDDLLIRMQTYLEKAVSAQTASGISLFILREMAYPGANLLKFTPGQWRRLVRQACFTIRSVAPQARIAIEIIPQYLPSRGYTPYTFLDNLIHDGAPFDLILMSFSPPISARFTLAGYPDPAWLLSQLKTFADLGRPFLVRFSGLAPLGSVEEYLAWIGQVVDTIHAQPTVIGFYWNTTTLHPVNLIAVTWGGVKPDPVDLPLQDRLVEFIRAHSSQGEGITDTNGQVYIQAFAGEYSLRMAGDTLAYQVHIYRGEERRFQLPAPDLNPTLAVITPTSGYMDRPQRDGNDTLLWIAFVVLCVGMSCWGVFSRRGKTGTKNLNSGVKE